MLRCKLVVTELWAVWTGEGKIPELGGMKEDPQQTWRTHAILLFVHSFFFASGCTTSKYTVSRGALTVLEKLWKDVLDQVATTFMKAVGLAGRVSQTIRLLWLKISPAKPDSPAPALMSRYRGERWHPSTPRSPPKKASKAKCQQDLLLLVVSPGRCATREMP